LETSKSSLGLESTDLLLITLISIIMNQPNFFIMVRITHPQSYLILILISHRFFHCTIIILGGIFDAKFIITLVFPLDFSMRDRKSLKQSGIFPGFIFRNLKGQP
jgi:hypothetical protein